MTLGWQASLASKIMMPFLRLDAPSRENTPNFPSSVVITSLLMRASLTIESAIFGCVTSEMSIAYTRSAIVERYAHLPLGCTHTSTIAYTRSAIVERYAHLPLGCTHTSALRCLTGRWARTSR